MDPMSPLACLAVCQDLDPVTDSVSKHRGQWRKTPDAAVFLSYATYQLTEPTLFQDRQTDRRRQCSKDSGTVGSRNFLWAQVAVLTSVSAFHHLITVLCVVVHCCNHFTVKSAFSTKERDQWKLQLKSIPNVH